MCVWRVCQDAFSSTINVSTKYDGSSSGAVCFQMVCRQFSGTHQHTSCASSTKIQRTASGRMSAAAVSGADACPPTCCSCVYIRLFLSFAVIDIAVFATLSTCREAVQHTRVHTHTLSQGGCILPSTDARRITVREITVNICSMTMMRLGERRIIYSVTSFYGCLSYINSLPLFKPPCPSLTHSLPPPLLFYLTIFSLPPSVYPLLVLLTLCQVLSLILIFFHTLPPSHSSLCACQSFSSPPLPNLCLSPAHLEQM